MFMSLLGKLASCFALWILSVFVLLYTVIFCSKFSDSATIPLILGAINGGSIMTLIAYLIFRK